MTRPEQLATIRAMREHGGSFAKALAEAWACADSVNSAVIEAAFAKVIRNYTPAKEVA